MEESKQFVQILLAFLGVAAFLWLYLKAAAVLDAWHERHFPAWHRWRHRLTNIQIQTLFHGNTKNEDQI